MIKNNKVEEIRKILLKTLDNEGFVQELLEKYAGNEDLILKMIEESFSELLEEANPYKWTPVSPAVFLSGDSNLVKPRRVLLRDGLIKSDGNNERTGLIVWIFITCII